jgi:Domain of unknown function (DUF4372)/Transposase DDE domain
MNQGRTVFSQLVEFLPTYQFQICVDRYQGNRYVKDFSCWDQFLCLAFAQLTYRESLRDIEACLRAQQPKLYHMGFRGQVSRNTLAHANEHRDWRIYADFAQVLIAAARDLYRGESFGVELSETVYALDSTTIDLCLSLFPWGKFRRHKSAVKLHTLLDLRGSIPTNVYVTGGQVHDVNILDQLLPEAGAFYLLDRGYVDFARLYVLAQACAFFVTRAKKNMQFYRRNSRPVERSAGLRSDQTILLTGVRTAQCYPDPLRRIHYFDAERDSRLTFLTNNFSPSRFDYHPVVPGTLESGIVFSLDQTAPAHQGFLRHLGERGEDPSVGGLIGLRARGDCQKATGAGPELVQNSADSQRHSFRKNPNSRGVFQLQRRDHRCRTLHPVESIRLLMGQH